MEDRDIYDYIGGEEAFRRLVDAFYRGVEADAILRPLYPDDLAESRENLALFLMQFFGGPTTYNEKRGHPRLKMRHVPFSIGPAERDAWMLRMCAAIAEADIPEPARARMLRYFEETATFLINRPAETVPWREPR